MEFTLEELYDFANVSSPGGNHYTIEETNRVWNTEKGLMLSSFCDPNSFYQHFIMVHIYGNMAQRYSGVFDTKELYIVEENPKLKDFYDFLEDSIFPYGYKFLNVKENSGYKLMIQKDDEPLENLRSRIGVEYYNDIPDKVHRPSYYTKTHKVKTYLNVSLFEFKQMKHNEEVQVKTLDQLRRFEFEVQKKNIENFVRKIKDYDIDKVREILYEINYENDEYDVDFDNIYKSILLEMIEHELLNSYYNWSRKIMLKY
jgi:hypothetical protein